MKASVIRAKYLKFYERRGHAVIPAAPIIPPDDPTTLFTSSGMQQLVPYLKGEPHSMGTRLVDSQPSFRAEDIEEVGDNRHTCMFEMLGNWSLGDYFKKEQLPWVYEFFTKEVGLDPARLHVTLFEGDEFAARDTEGEAIWKSIGVSADHIHFIPPKRTGGAVLVYLRICLSVRSAVPTPRSSMILARRSNYTKTLRLPKTSAT